MGAGSRPERRAAPAGYRWATGGGSPIGCNGLHLAPDDGTRGTLCGLYGPATTVAFPGTYVCGNCARIAAGRGAQDIRRCDDRPRWVVA